ncbi:MAG: response regulator transcription factor [Lachnospiraceae bacterium]|jgi:DNA-binding LytR/AlgR family response regulator|nr:response regulator transcription factor [Lachnospiraceae bacterium]
MNTEIKIAICDDEASSRELLERMCRAFFQKKEQLTKTDIHAFASGEEVMTSGTDYDILLLDIEMPAQDGIVIKDDFETNRKQTRIIFTTSHQERVLEAFGKNVTGFLVKPIDETAFQNVMEKTLSDICGPVLETEENGNTFMIPMKRIKYIEAQDKYTLLVTETGEYLMRKTMKFWENALPGQDFVRIHKSYLVHLEYFEKKGDEVWLDKGKHVKISRFRKHEIMEKYKDFLRRKVKVM